MRALVLADVHYDPLYDAHARPDCMCRSECANASATPLAFGQPGCDSPSALLDSTLSAAAGVLPSPDVVFIMGDNMAHHLARYNGSVFAKVNHQMLASFPGVPCVAVIGNNDVYPDYAIRLADSSIFSQQAATIARHCNLTSAAADTMRKGGYYAHEPFGPGGLRVLALNTGPFSAQPKAPKVDPVEHPDPYLQFEWLESELVRANETGARVLLLGHAPPCLDYFDRQPIWQAPFTERYWSLIDRFAVSIAGQLFGHMHTNQFRVFGNAGEASQSLVVSLSRAGSAAAAKADEMAGDAMATPPAGAENWQSGRPSLYSPPLMVLSSISPIFGNNPSFHVLSFSGTADGENVGGSETEEVEAAATKALRLTRVEAYFADLVATNADLEIDDAHQRIAVKGGAMAAARHPRQLKFANLYDTAHPGGDAPEGSRSLAHDPIALTNARYAALVASMDEAPGPTVHGDAAWMRFHAILSAHGRLSTNQSCGEHSLSEEVGDCRVCEGGCRAAWLCLLLHGLDRADYEGCLARSAAASAASPAILQAMQPGSLSHSFRLQVAARPPFMSATHREPSRAVLALQPQLMLPPLLLLLPVAVAVWLWKARGADWMRRSRTHLSDEGHGLGAGSSTSYVAM